MIKYRKVSAPARKSDYVGKQVTVCAEAPPAANNWRAGYGLKWGMTVTIDRRMNAMETQNSGFDVSCWGSIRVLRLSWKCPTCDTTHTAFLPESWIAENKLVFVELLEREAV